MADETREEGGAAVPASWWRDGVLHQIDAARPRPLTALPFQAATTAKEQLRQTVDELTEAEAADTLDFLTRRRSGGRDTPSELLDSAPVDDEPTMPEEDAGAREAREQIARGEVFSAEQIKREIA
jgi:hypothetical protein